MKQEIKHDSRLQLQNKLSENQLIDASAPKELYKGRDRNPTTFLDKKLDKAISPLGSTVGRVALLVGAFTLVSTVIAPPLAPILAGVTAGLVGATVGITVIHNLRQLTRGNNKPQPINESLLEDRLVKQDIPSKQKNLDKTNERSKGHELSKGIETSIDNIKSKAPKRERSNNEANKTAVFKSKESQHLKTM